MPYKKRIYVPECHYHVVSRGNRRDPLFMDWEDYDVFFYNLEDIYDKYPFEITSYCLMNNHYHLQLRSQIISISKLMALINKKYANYYNTKYKLTGHVYEKRFFDDILADQRSMLAVSRYIHLNPVEALMVKSPDQYPWSSMQYFMTDMETPRYLNIDCILDCFEGTKDEKREQYFRFLKEKPWPASQ
ncbi:transposase [Cytobacillus gottheilii]|uniref:transposase n=1 Tax=Cytobacillus gottheilii TaxID=859144 RepID=UPI002494FAC6|nr:transposase [Cytobacillus gottheilii]